MGATREQWLSAAITGYVREEARNQGVELTQDEILDMADRIQGITETVVKYFVEVYNGIKEEE